MDPHKVDRLVGRLARPIYVYRMNYSNASILNPHRLSRPRVEASRKLMDQARADIDTLVSEYVRDSR